MEVDWSSTGGGLELDWRWTGGGLEVDWRFVVKLCCNVVCV